MIDDEGAMLEAAPGEGREEFGGEQQRDPWLRVEMASHGHEILAIRSPVIESAGEPRLCAHFRDCSKVAGSDSRSARQGPESSSEGPAR